MKFCRNGGNDNDNGSPGCAPNITLKLKVASFVTLLFFAVITIVRQPISNRLTKLPVCIFEEGPKPLNIVSQVSSNVSMLYPSVTYEIVNSRKYTKGKKFVYLVQGPFFIPIKGLHESSERDVIWLTFENKSGDIFSPLTTAISGRNALLHYAVNLASKSPDGGYLYYIFMDDDIEIALRNESRVNWKPWNLMKTDPFERFEDFLTDFLPAVGYVRFQDNWRQPTNLSRSTDLHHDFDECFNAFHRDTLSFLLPYDAHFDYDSWYTGGWIARHHMGMLYHSYRIQCNSLHIDNTHHGGRGNGRYKAGYDYVKPRDYINSAIASRDLRKSVLRADKKGHGLQPIGRMPGEPKTKGNHSYLITDQYIENNFRVDHPMIQKLLSWRRTPEVENILHFRTRKNEPAFVADSLYTDSPSHFWV